MSRKVILALIGGAAIAHADPDPRANDLFEQGRVLRDRGEWAAACAKFAESFTLDHAAGTELSLGDCHEHLGHAELAWHFFDSAATEFARAGDKRVEFARSRANGLLPKLATVVVKLAEPAAGIEITIGGRTVTPGPTATTLSDHFEPGDITVEAKVPGKQPFRQTTHAVAGATVVVEIPAMAGAIGVKTETTSSRRKSRVKLAIAGAGGGVALFGTGIALGLVAKGQYDHEFTNGNCFHQGGEVECNNPQKIASANSLANVGTGFAVVGIVCAAAAAVVFFTAPHDLVVAPAAGKSELGVALSGRF